MTLQELQPRLRRFNQAMIIGGWCCLQASCLAVSRVAAAVTLDKDAEKVLIRSLWLGGLPPVPADPTNAVSQDPRAAAMGHALFFRYSPERQQPGFLRVSAIP